ncbi:ABC transporter substrate-binding protein [Microbacterium soli]|uniref:SsuA/THI5-like domain-containing protein n=1 Tax=Microbacterium soli TaxID=446075 RepID=A0ABP7N5T3_9MICO
MFNRRIRATTALLAMLPLAVLAAACSAEETVPENDAAGGPTPLTVAVSPGAETSAPMYLAIERGVFEDLGLDLTLTVLNDGSIAIPNTLNGQTQFSMSGFGPAAQAIEKGLAIKMIGAANVIPTDPDSVYQAIVVGKDSGIDSMADVSTWAADSTEVDPSQAFAVDALGGDYAALQKVAVPFPSIGDAVADGTVDAALLNEPFLTAALETGKVDVLSYIAGELTIPGAPGAVFIGSDEYMAANPDVTAAFIDGVEEAYRYASENMQEVADFIPETGLSERIPKVEEMSEYQVGPLQASAVQPLLDVYADYGAISGTVSAEEMIHRS